MSVFAAAMDRIFTHAAMAAPALWDLAAMMQAEIAAGETAVTTAMHEAGAGLKSAWRGQITGAGLGTRLGNSIRLATYPKGSESLNAAALVITLTMARRLSEKQRHRCPS